jgi:hypothetical protein
MKVWFDDPQELINREKVLQFWPTNKQSAEERVNAASRFIIYAACFIYLIRRDPRIFVLAATVMGVLYVMYNSDMVKEGTARPTVMEENGYSTCQMPTDDNPMGNMLLSDFVDRPDRPSACHNSSVRNNISDSLENRTKYMPGRSRTALPKYQANAMARQFVSNPVTSAMGDQTGFAEWCYGKKMAPMCKSDGTQCNPDARGVQLEAFGGLDPSGDKRSGMHRGSGLRSGHSA